MKKINSILWLLIFFYAASLYADEAKFYATVDRNSVAAGEQFQITFTLSNASGTNFKNPGFKGFTVLMGPSTSQSMSMINGVVTRSVSYSYVLQAESEGQFTIGPASIVVDGKTLQSNSISISVGKGTPQQQQATKNEKTLNDQANEILKKNIFVKLFVNKKDVYVGEPITASYKLYFNPELSIVDNRLAKEPFFNGFWTQEIGIGQMRYSTEVLNGVQFRVAEIRKFILFPQQSGRLTLEPLEIDFTARLVVRSQQQRKRRGFFDDFFDFPSTKDFSYTASSETTKINVKPLPSSAPDDFRGAVGSFQLDAGLDKQKTKTNDPVTLKIKISGSGNLKLVEAFDVNLPPDIETYEPKTSDNINVTASGMSGSRTYEYLLIPRNSGDFKIGPVTFSYFDLASKQYRTLSSKEFKLTVEKGEGGETSIVSGANKEEIQYIGKDIRYIKDKSDRLSRRGEKLYASVGFYFLTLTPLVLFLLFFILLKKRRKLYENQMLLKNKRATKAARKRLVKAKQYLTQSNHDKFYEEISHALWNYLSDKLGIPFSDLTKDSVSLALAALNTPDEKIEKYLSTIDYCEFARFSPSGGAQEMEKSYNDAASAIAELEVHLK